MVWRPRCRPRTEARARRQDDHSRGLTPDGPLRKEIITCSPRIAAGPAPGKPGYAAASRTSSCSKQPARFLGRVMDALAEELQGLFRMDAGLGLHLQPDPRRNRPPRPGPRTR